MARGNLVVSTRKQQTVRLIILGVGGVLFALMGIFCMLVPQAFESELVAYGLGIFMIGWPIFEIFKVWNGQKSYLAVYDDHIEGLSLISWTKPQEEFNIAFSDIVNISKAKYNIEIQTPYKTYRALAMTNQDAAIAEIRARIIKNQ